MPPRKVQKLSRNQQVIKPVREKEHSCTEEDIVNSFREIGLEELVKGY